MFVFWFPVVLHQLLLTWASMMVVQPFLKNTNIQNALIPVISLTSHSEAFMELHWEYLIRRFLSSLFLLFICSSWSPVADRLSGKTVTEFRRLGIKPYPPCSDGVKPASWELGLWKRFSWVALESFQLFCSWKAAAVRSVQQTWLYLNSMFMLMMLHHGELQFHSWC